MIWSSTVTRYPSNGNVSFHFNIELFFLLSLTRLSLLDLTMSNTAGVWYETGTAYHSGAPGFTPGFGWGLCCYHSGPLGSPQGLGGIYVATIEEPLGSPQVLGGVYVATIEEPLGSPQGLGFVYVATIEEPLGSPQGFGWVLCCFSFYFSVLCFFCFLFVFILCFALNVASFWIVQSLCLSVFTSVYLLTSVCAMTYFLHHAFVFLLGTNHFFHWKPVAVYIFCKWK